MKDLYELAEEFNLEYKKLVTYKDVVDANIESDFNGNNTHNQSTYLINISLSNDYIEIEIQRIINKCSYLNTKSFEFIRKYKEYHDWLFKKNKCYLRKEINLYCAITIKKLCGEDNKIKLDHYLTAYSNTDINNYIGKNNNKDSNIENNENKVYMFIPKSLIIESNKNRCLFKILKALNNSKQRLLTSTKIKTSKIRRNCINSNLTTTIKNSRNKKTTFSFLKQNTIVNTIQLFFEYITIEDSYYKPYLNMINMNKYTLNSNYLEDYLIYSRNKENKDNKDRCLFFDEDKYFLQTKGLMSIVNKAFNYSFILVRKLLLNNKIQLNMNSGFSYSMNSSDFRNYAFSSINSIIVKEYFRKIFYTLFFYVESRHFSSENGDSYIIPLADALNHNNVNVCYSYSRVELYDNYNEDNKDEFVIANLNNFKYFDDDSIMKDCDFCIKRNDYYPYFRDYKKDTMIRKLGKFSFIEELCLTLCNRNVRTHLEKSIINTISSNNEYFNITNIANSNTLSKNNKISNDVSVKKDSANVLLYEVYNNYGSYANNHFLKYYSFTPLDNDNDYYSFELDILISDLYISQESSLNGRIIDYFFNQFDKNIYYYNEKGFNISLVFDLTRNKPNKQLILLLSLLILIHSANKERGFKDSKEEEIEKRNVENFISDTEITSLDKDDKSECDNYNDDVSHKLLYVIKNKYFKDASVFMLSSCEIIKKYIYNNFSSIISKNTDSIDEFKMIRSKDYSYFSDYFNKNNKSIPSNSYDYLSQYDDSKINSILLFNLSQKQIIFNHYLILYKAFINKQ